MLQRKRNRPGVVAGKESGRCDRSQNRLDVYNNLLSGSIVNLLPPNETGKRAATWYHCRHALQNFGICDVRKFCAIHRSNSRRTDVLKRIRIKFVCEISTAQTCQPDVYLRPKKKTQHTARNVFSKTRWPEAQCFRIRFFFPGTKREDAVWLVVNCLPSKFSLSHCTLKHRSFLDCTGWHERKPGQTWWILICHIYKNDHTVKKHNYRCRFTPVTGIRVRWYDLFVNVPKKSMLSSKFVRTCIWFDHNGVGISWILVFISRRSLVLARN